MKATIQRLKTLIRFVSKHAKLLTLNNCCCKHHHKRTPTTLTIIPTTAPTVTVSNSNSKPVYKVVTCSNQVSNCSHNRLILRRLSNYWDNNQMIKQLFLRKEEWIRINTPTKQTPLNNFIIICSKRQPLLPCRPLRTEKASWEWVSKLSRRNLWLKNQLAGLKTLSQITLGVV